MSRLRIAVRGRVGSFLAIAFIALAVGVLVGLFMVERREHEAAVAVVDAVSGQESLSHTIVSGILRSRAGDPRGVATLESAVPELIAGHRALRYGDQSAGIRPAPDSVAGTFSDLEPLVVALEGASTRVAVDPDDIEAGTRAIDLAEDYRMGLQTVRLEVDEHFGRRLDRWVGVEVAVLAIVVITTIGLALTLRTAHHRPITLDEERRMDPSEIDQLTGLPLRTVLRDRLDNAIVKSRQQRRLAAVLSVDIDHFDRINREFGREIGDRLLQAIADRLRGSVRAGDTVARFTGDLFCVLVEGQHRAEDAAVVAEKVLAAVSGPVDAGPARITVSASVGIAVAPHDADRADTLIDQADIAMHAAKRMGRNTYQFFSPELRVLARGRLEMIDGLRRALNDRQGLRLVYQPKVDLTTGRLCGAEALVRWDHPTLGEIYPDDFIPLAEETELIITLGRWVLQTACAQAVAWQSGPLGDLPVSVNVSPRQFRHGDLTAVVRDALVSTGLSPSLLEIEVTERVLMDDTDRIRSTLAGLQRIGVSIAIDDFGTGFSSLGYLKRFPIDSLKIDREFIGELGTDGGDDAIASAIIAMAHNLGLEVVAEGVEDVGQLMALRALDCDIAQGFLFSRGLSGKAIEGFATRMPQLVDARLWAETRPRLA